jgi:hypothetical protein
MTTEAKETGKEWAKVVLTVVVSSLVSAAMFTFFLGGVVKQVEINTGRIDQHLGTYTPRAYESDAQTKERVIALEVNTANIDKILTELKRENETQHQAILLELNKLNRKQ